MIAFLCIKRQTSIILVDLCVWLFWKRKLDHIDLHPNDYQILEEATVRVLEVLLLPYERSEFHLEVVFAKAFVGEDQEENQNEPSRRLQG